MKMKKTWAALRQFNPHDRLLHGWIMERYPSMQARYQDPIKCNIGKVLWRKALFLNASRLSHFLVGQGFAFAAFTFLIWLFQCLFSDREDRALYALGCAVGFALATFMYVLMAYRADMLRKEADGYEKDILILPRLSAKANELRRMIRARHNYSNSDLKKIVSEYALVIWYYHMRRTQPHEEEDVPLLLKDWNLPEDSVKFVQLALFFRLMPTFTIRQSNSGKPPFRRPFVDPDDDTTEADWWKNRD